MGEALAGRRRWILVAVAVVVLALLVAAVARALTAGATEKPATAATVAVDRGAVSTEVATSGTLQPAQTRSLSFAVQGTVASVAVRAGTTVIAGQALAKVDDTDAATAVDTARARATPRRWWNRGTVALGALVLLLGGFLGGLQAQKHWGTAATAAGNRPGGFTGNQNRAGYAAFGGGALPGGVEQGGALPGGAAPGGAAPAGAVPASSAASAGTTGTVKLVDGDTVYVQTANGDVVTVQTDARTTVVTATAGRLSDVKAGESVTVQGTAGADGTVTATSVTARRK
jgi:hypothetical protein